MPGPNKVFLSVVVGAACLYFYDVQYNQGQNVDALGLYNWNKRKQPVSVFSRQMDFSPSAASSYGESKYSQLSDGAKDKYAQAKKQAEAAYSSAYDNMIAAQKDVSGHYSDLKNWGEQKNSEAKDNYNKAVKQLDDARKGLQQYGADAVSQVDAVYSKMTDSVRSQYVKIADSISTGNEKSKELAQDAYDSALSQYDVAKAKLDSSKKWFGMWKSDQYDQFKKQYDASKKNMEDTKKSLQQYGQDTIQKADDSHKRRVDAISKSFGNTKEQAENYYLELAAGAEELQRNVQAQGTAASAEIQKKAADAQQAVYLAEENLRKYGEDAYEQTANKFSQLSDDVKKSYAESAAALESQWDKVTSNLKDAYETVAGKVQDGLDAVQDVASDGYNSVVTEANKAYASAYDKYKEAQEAVDEANSGFLSWTSEQSQQATEKLAKAKKQWEDSKNALEKYGSNAAKDAQKKYDSTIKAIQNSFGNSKEAATETYNEFAAQVEAAQKVIEAKGNANAKDAQEKLDQARYNLALARDNLKKYGTNAANDAQNNYSKLTQRAKDSYAAAADQLSSKYNDVAEAAKKSLRESYEAAEKRSQDAYLKALDRYNYAVKAGEQYGQKASDWSEKKRSNTQKSIDNAKAALNSAQKSLSEYGDEAMSEAKKNYDENIKSIRASFGKTKEDAANAYANALNEVQNYEKQLDSLRSSWIGWNKKQQEIVQEKLDQSNKQLVLSEEHLKDFGSDFKAEVENKFKK